MAKGIEQIIEEMELGGYTVKTAEVTVEDIRETTDEYSDKLATLMDEAQGEVFMGNTDECIVIIRVKKE